VFYIDRRTGNDRS